MPAISFFLNGDDCWPDLPKKRVINVMGNDAPSIGVAVLDGGMVGGRPSVTLRIDLPDGRVVLTETSARLFCSAARMILARYPDLLEVTEMSKKPERLGDAPIEDKFREQMRSLAKALDQILNGEKAGTDDSEVGFCLLMFNFGDGASRANYISNAKREDVVTLLKEQLARFEGQPEMKGTA